MTRNEATDRAAAIWGGPLTVTLREGGGADVEVQLTRGIEHHRIDANGHAVCHDDCDSLESLADTPEAEPMNPYDRMAERSAQEEAERVASFERAIRERYHLVQVSRHRWRVIRRGGHATLSLGIHDVLSFVFVTPPLKWSLAHIELQKLRRTVREGIQALSE